MWKARVFTLYPEIFPGPLSKGLYGKALQKKIWDLEVIDIRDSAEDKHCLLYTSDAADDS